MMNGVLNAGYPGYPSFNYNQSQSLPQQPSQNHQPIRQQQAGQPVLTQPSSYPGQPGPQPNSYNMAGQPNMTQPNSYNGNAQLSRPLMASSPMSDDGANLVVDGEEDNTRMRMRLQRDAANAAGMKCSQF